MTMTDPIADMLTRIRNANMVKHKNVEMPASRLKLEVARVLTEEGYISGFAQVGDEKKPTLRIQLKYFGNGERVIHGLKRVSKPGCRIYAAVTELPKVLGGLGISIISTSRGVLSGEKAREANVGGEVLCEVW
jgi:small subunit ribosomal protein S8